MAKTAIHYWIPELFWPEPDDQQALQGLRCPNLEKLLAKAPWQRAPKQMHEAFLAQQLGFSPDVSLAALRWLGDFPDQPSLSSDCWCADPVHLRFHHEQIVLADASVLALQAEEVTQLVAGLNRDFADVGRFEAAANGRWYVHLAPAHQGLAASLPSRVEVTGRRLTGERLHVPQSSPSQAGAGQAKIRHWQNEIQMWLHAHPVNTARTEAGLPLVNGLWIWGGGQPPVAVQTPDVVCFPVGQTRSTELSVLLRGAATSLGIPSVDSLAGEGRKFVLDERLLQPVLYEDSAAWRTALEALDRDLIGPLLAGGKEVILWTTGLYGVFSVHLKDYRAWAFWQSVRPYADRLQDWAGAA